MMQIMPLRPVPEVTYHRSLNSSPGLNAMSRLILAKLCD
jgi:hypothetical protein